MQICSLALRRYSRHASPVFRHISWSRCLSTGPQENTSRKSAALFRQSIVQQIDAQLPLHLRKKTQLEVEPGAEDVLKIANLVLLSDQFDTQTAKKEVDILYWLAVKEGRWEAVTWIVRQILSVIDPNFRQASGILNQLVETGFTGSLKALSAQPIELEIGESTERVSIDGMLFLEQPDDEDGEEGDIVEKTHLDDEATHRVLGAIWRSMGRMTLACMDYPTIAKGSIRREILEMLGAFHHHGLMPDSVYSYTPSDQPDALQQPATLYLLSSRIMMALIDAAWRAEEAAMLQAGTATTPFEKRGPAVRANFDVVKPEIWLELILWSCLHGGWTMPGADILVELCKQDTAWRPLSWRRSLKEYFDIDKTTEVDWNKLLTEFSISRRQYNDAASIQLDRTISSEVINAFIEALIDSAHVSAYDEVHRPQRTLHHIKTFHHFLQQHELNLHGSTWNSIIQRIVDTSSSQYKVDNTIHRLAQLAPIVGEELKSHSELEKPKHILDGSAAFLGILHRALMSQISEKKLTGAISVLNTILKFVDASRQQSMQDFFSSTQQSEDFSKLRRVQHPSFNHQIPLTTISSLLDLITELGAFDVGRALVHDPLGDALISESDMTNPRLRPALQRFAKASGDMAILSKTTVSNPRWSSTYKPVVADSKVQYKPGKRMWQPFPTFEDTRLVQSHDHDLEQLSETQRYYPITDQLRS